MDVFEVTYGLNGSDRTFDYATGDELTFSGKGYDYLRGKFYTGSCEDQRNIVSIRVYKCKCDRWYEFQIRAGGTSFCPDTCTITVSMERSSQESKAYRYLSETIFWKNGFIDAFTHPKVYYCNQPGFVQYLLLNIAIVLFPLIVVQNAIASVVRRICKIVTLGSGRCDLGPVDDLNVCSIYETIGGCGQFSPSPLIRDILTFNAEAAGLRFISSIFQGKYQNLCLFQLQYEAGTSDDGVNWIAGNAANLTTIQLLDLLKEPFACDYRIIGDELVVEQDFAGYATNLGQVSGCFAQKIDPPPAYADMQYTDDPIDRQGNRLRSNYDDVIELNPDGEEWRKGKYEVTAKFGRARFMFDQRGSDKADEVPGGDRETFLGDNFIDRFRSTNALNFFGCRDDRRERDLIVSNDMAAQLKLLLLEDEFNPLDAHTVRRPHEGNFFAYNFPMYFAEEEVEGLWPLHDPDGQGGYELGDARLALTCELAARIDEASGYSVTTPLGEATVEEVTVGDEYVTLKNIFVPCSR